MDPETIKARLETLKADRANILEQLEQLRSNLNAYNGAIEDCEYWLAEIQKKNNPGGE